MSARGVEIPAVQTDGGEMVTQSFLNVMCNLDHFGDSVGDVICVEQNRVPVVGFRDGHECFGFVGE